MNRDLDFSRRRGAGKQTASDKSQAFHGVTPQKPSIRAALV